MSDHATVNHDAQYFRQESMDSPKRENKGFLSLESDSMWDSSDWQSFDNALYATYPLGLQSEANIDSIVPDTLQNPPNGPGNVDVENFNDIVTDQDMSNHAQVPAYHNSEILKEEEQSHSFEAMFSSASGLPVMWPAPLGLPVMSPPPLELPIMSPAPSGLPVMSTPPLELPIMSPAPSGLPVMSTPPLELPIMSPAPSGLPVMSPAPLGLPVMSPSQSAVQVLTPSQSLGNMLQGWSVDEGGLIKVESVTEETSSYFPLLDPSVDPWKQDYKSSSNAFLSTTTIKKTSFVIQSSLPGSPIGRPLSSFSHGFCRDENDKVVKLEPSSPQDTILPYGRDEMETSAGVFTHCPDQSTERGIIEDQTVERYHCRVCWRRFKRRPDCNRHERSACGSDDFICIVCKKDLCRRDSLMRHLTRNEGRNPCSLVLEAAKITNKAVASRRASREDLGTDREIEEALTKYEAALKKNEGWSVN